MGLWSGRSAERDRLSAATQWEFAFNHHDAEPAEGGPAAPAPSPKLVEVPLDGPATPAKPQPPALFVLQNGQQIETDRYVLSDRSVTVDVGRQQRTIPLSDINVNETTAANRQRGVDIAFPRDSNSLFMSF